MRYSFTISHVAGKDLVTADTLSRSPVSISITQDEKCYQDVEAYVNFVFQNLPASDQRIEQIKEEQGKDEICRQLVEYCKHGWPRKGEIPHVLKPYFSVSGEITIQNGLLMRGSRIIIPPPLHSNILETLHKGHFGISKCREKARNSVWWPNLSKQLADVVENCATCCKFQKQAPEPLMPSVLPTLPWQKVASDLFKWRGTIYLLVIDYTSKYIEISKLDNETSHEVILRLKSIFARHGIPLEVFSDNVPQYSSMEFSEFAKAYKFVHTTSSPKFPQSNGEAERAVRTIKTLLQKADDPYATLLAYRSTPVCCGCSPAELLMNRQLCSTVPIAPTQLQPAVPDYSRLKEREEAMREKQTDNFNSCHRSRELTPLLPGETLWVTDQQTPATVVELSSPRSYQIQTSFRMLRRNRRHLNPLRNSVTDARMESDPNVAITKNPPPEMNSQVTTEVPNITHTRSGRISAPPSQLVENHDWH